MDVSGVLSSRSTALALMRADRGAIVRSCRVWWAILLFLHSQLSPLAGYFQLLNTTGQLCSANLTHSHHILSHVARIIRLLLRPQPSSPWSLPFHLVPGCAGAGSISPSPSTCWPFLQPHLTSTFKRLVPSSTNFTPTFYQIHNVSPPQKGRVPT